MNKIAATLGAALCGCSSSAPVPQEPHAPDVREPEAVAEDLARTGDPAELDSKLSVLSDEEVRAVFETFDDYSLWGAHDALLVQMVSRGGSAWSPFLTECLIRRRAYGGSFELPSDLEILTALNRIEGAPDPLRVIVDGSRIETVFPELPVLEVYLENASDSETFGYKRGLFRTRWRMELCDSEGREIQARRDWDSVVFISGASRRLRLHPGDRSGPFALPMARYAIPPGPGTYEVQVLYHDHESIAWLEDRQNLVLSTSSPLRFSWLPREVRLSAEERHQLASLLPRLYSEEPVLRTLTPYREGREFGGDPETASARLYAAGWKSLPVLFDALDSERDLGRRARLLAMLSNITGLNHPLGLYQSLGDFRIVNGKSSEYAGQSFSVGDYRGNPPGEQSLRPLEDAWRTQRDLVKVVE